MCPQYVQEPLCTARFGALVARNLKPLGVSAGPMWFCGADSSGGVLAVPWAPHQKSSGNRETTKQPKLFDHESVFAFSTTYSLAKSTQKIFSGLLSLFCSNVGAELKVGVYKQKKTGRGDVSVRLASFPCHKSHTSNTSFQVKGFMISMFGSLFKLVSA